MPMAAELDLAQDGLCLRAGLATPVIDLLGEMLACAPQGKAGVRLTQWPELAALLDSESVIGRSAAAILGDQCFPVRTVLFDKSDHSNWSLGWHQDRTIAVRRRHEVEGFGPWSMKQGIQHVEPPFEVIESMITLRVHLDPIDVDNAPLRVALGSHRFGRLPVSTVDALAARGTVFECHADRGDVWVYRTPIVHASRAAMPGRRRRVLQIDYAAQCLPNGLEWLGI